MVESNDPCEAINFLNRIIAADGKPPSEIAKLSWNKNWAILSVKLRLYAYVTHFAAAGRLALEAILCSNELRDNQRCSDM